MRARFVVFGLLLLLGSQPRPVGASEGQPSSAEAWMMLKAARIVRADTVVDDVRSRLLQIYWRADIDGGGISSSDRDLQARLNTAQHRSRQLSQWLRMDLDGDGSVTLAELESYHGKAARQPLRTQGVTLEPTPEQIARTLRKLVDKSLRADRSGDQVVTFAEMLAAAEVDVRKRSARYGRRHRAVPLSLDADGDKTVSRKEFVSLAERVLERIDTDGDGVLSQSEAAALKGRVPQLQKMERAAAQTRRRETKRRELAEACRFPAASPKARIVLLSANQGRALSTVGLGGDDVVVGVADAWIEPGTEPLYVLLTSAQATVWRFTGAVDRIEAVVATSLRRGPDKLPLAGIVGVKRERVHLPERPDCLAYFRNRKGNRAAKARSNVTAFVGRAPDVVLRSGSVSTVSLPGGIFDRGAAYRNAKPLPDTGAGAPLWREALRRAPGGLVEIDPARVVSRAKAQPYTVLPRQAGLARLLDEGALEIIGTTKVVRFNGLEFVTGGGADNIVVPKGKTAQVVERPNAFLIVKKIRFPAGLSGGHAVTFQLAPGVPEPEGSPGHSCVRHQATGEPVAGNSHCR